MESPEKKGESRWWRTQGARRVRLAIYAAGAIACLYVVALRPMIWRWEADHLRRDATRFIHEDTPHPDMIGWRAGVAPKHRWAFAPSDAFEPLPAPGTHDWAATAEEPSQSIWAFLEDRPAFETGATVVYLRPVAPFDARRAPELETLRRYLSAYFQKPVRLLPELSNVSITTRQVDGVPIQLLTSDILDLLADERPEDAAGVIGLTTADLYPRDDWGFVFGEASPARHVGVWGVARYHADAGDPDPTSMSTDATQLLRDTIATMTHEVGHLLGLAHCYHFLCNLNGAASLEESRRGTLALCPVCLRKLYAVDPFSPSKRYRELRAFYRAHGLKEEARWVQQRLKAAP